MGYCKSAAPATRRLFTAAETTAWCNDLTPWMEANCQKDDPATPLAEPKDSNPDCAGTYPVWDQYCKNAAPATRRLFTDAEKEEWCGKMKEFEGRNCDPENPAEALAEPADSNPDCAGNKQVWDM